MSLEVNVVLAEAKGVWNGSRILGPPCMGTATPVN